MQAVSKFTGLTDEALNFFTSAKRYEIIALSCMLENELWKDVLHSYIRYANTAYEVLFRKTLESKIESELGDWVSELYPKGKKELKMRIARIGRKRVDKEVQMSALFALSNRTTDLAKAISESFAERKLRTIDIDKSIKSIKEDVDVIDKEEKDALNAEYRAYIRAFSPERRPSFEEWRKKRYGE